MSCADVCLSMDYDGSLNEFFNEKDVVAKKTHQCCECQEPIASGETYERASGKSDGDFWTNATCGPCAEIRKTFCCGSWIYGELWESIRSEMFPVWREKGEWDCLAKLTTEAAIAKCNAEYREYLSDCEQEGA